MTAEQLLGAWAGHWTGDGTGVTVVLPPPGTVGSGEVRGGAPATREFELLGPTRLVERVDAVVLSGGSAYGLAAGHGVMELLRERGTGFATPAGVVPIVVGMSIFDGSVGGTPPGAEAGRAAALAGLGGAPLAVGRVGAGAGASSGKWRGRRDPGGVGWAVRSAGAARVAALIVVNPWGDVLGPDGRPLFGSEPGEPGEPGAAAEAGELGAAGEAPQAAFQNTTMQNTTIGVVLTDARLSKPDCFLLAQSAHTGYARTIHPAHSRYDGDAVVALSTGSVEAADLDRLRIAVTEATVAAIRAAVG